MEASDVFAQGVEIGDGEDPFAGTDFGDFGADGPTEARDEPADDTPDLPVVNREGQPVEPDPTPAAANGTTGSTTEPGPTPEAQAALESLRASRAGTEDPTPPAESAGPTEAPTDESAAPAAAPAAQEPAAPPEASPGAPAPVAESEPQDAPDSPQPPSPPSEAASDGSATEEAPVEDAPEPQEPRSQVSGRVTHRRYVILRVIGPGKFEQIAWHVDGKGRMVQKGTGGAKRQTVALARGTDDALKIGYAAIGSPAEGTSLIAVAAAYFQVKKIKPMPVEPARQRLSIS